MGAKQSTNNNINQNKQLTNGIIVLKDAKLTKNFN
jgi:hypothetical protein